jgi:hypothetical protein
LTGVGGQASVWIVGFLHSKGRRTATGRALVITADALTLDMVRGHWTYVLYDPEQPDECDVDSDRLVTEFGRVNGKKRRTSVPTWVSDEWTKNTLQPADDQGAWAASSAPIAEAAESAESASGSDSLVAGLKDLAQLHAGGALSDAEYADAKSRLLARG